MKHRLRRNIVYIAARFIAAVFCLLPIKAAVFLAGRLGVLLFFILKEHRQAAVGNLKSAFAGQKTGREIYLIAKAVFKNLGKSAAEFVCSPKINSRNIDKFVKAEGLEKIDAAFKAQKGVILLSCHFGNWELSAAYVGLKGYHLNVVFRPSREARYDNIINSLRRSKNINIIPRDYSFKRIVSILKDNQIVGILPDQDISSVDGVFVDFFNRKAYTPKGPVLLALVSGAPMFFIFCIRLNGVHKIIIEGPIELELTGNRENDILVNTQKWSDIAQKYISEYPQQWAWMHKRWKTQPK